MSKGFLATAGLLLGSILCHAAGTDHELEQMSKAFLLHGQSPVIAKHIQQMQVKARFHVIFIVTMPRIHTFGEMLIREWIKQLRGAGFPGSISVIIRGRRYFADAAYVRSWRWGIPSVIDSEGKVLKAISAWREDFPIATIWDSTGVLWWWSYVNLAPTGSDLKEFLSKLNESQHPFEEARQFVKTTPAGCIAESVGRTQINIPTAAIKKAIPLEDDSVHQIGPLEGGTISGNGRWFAALDFYKQCIRVFELQDGRLIATVCGDTQVFRARSWYVPDTLY